MQENQQQTKSDQIKSELHWAFSQLKRRSMYSRVFFGFSLLILILSLLIVVEQFQYLEYSTKLGVLLIGVLSGVGIFIRLRKKHPSFSFDSFYRIFARTQELNEINYYLDLEKDQQSNSVLVKAALDKNLSSINYEDFKKKLESYTESQTQTQFYKKSLKLLGSIFLLFVLTAFSFSDGAMRTVYLWESFSKPNPYSFTISPGNITFEQGSPFSANITFERTDYPENINLMVKTDVEDDFRSLNMELSNSGFVSIPFKLNSNLEYFIQMDEFQSEVFNATVQLRPRFSDLSFTIRPPSYTKLDSISQSYPFSLIRAYQGSKIILNGSLNKEIVQFNVSNSSNSLDSTYIENETFYAEISSVTPDTISFLLEDENGLRNKNPFQFILEPIMDSYPVVELVEPSNSFEMVEPNDLSITFKATDDFEITSGKLRYELKKAYVDEPKTSSLSIDRPANGVLQRFEWDLTNLNLSPLDELTFWIEATDNDGFNGRKTSRSQEITLKVPSLVDYFESLDKKEQDVETDLESISESFEEMSNSYDEFEKSLKENPETTYENQRQLDDAVKKQEEVQKKIDELNEKFNEIKKELSENNLLSEETQKAYDELKKLMEEIDNPELREALEKLRENMQQLTPEQLRRAMEDVAFSEEDYKKRLERTIELFKQLKLMSDLEKLAKSFEDQARQEKELAENPPSEQEAENKREEDLEQLEKLEEAVDQLSENKSEKTEKSVSDYQDETKEEIQKNIKKKIEEWLKQQNSGKKTKQPNFEQPFQQLAQKTREQMQSIGQQQQQINIAGLQYVLYSLLTISSEQEELVYSSQETEDRSLAYVELARDQKNVDQIFNALSDSLFELSKNIPQFSNQVNTKTLELKKQLERALTQMAERSQRNSSVASRQAFGGINEIAFMIANLLEQIQNNENSSGQGGNGSPQSIQQMIEKLGEMQGNQQQLNEQIQQMINEMQGERLSNDQMERLNQLAKQQNQIRKQLQDLQESGALDGDRAGSEIQRMIEEMEDTINDLRGGAVDPTLVERQQNILSRMLDAEKSMQERDEEEKEREAKQPGDFNRTSPSDITLEELEKQIRSRLNDPNFTKYSPDYQKLIERYFELLKKLQERSS